MRPVVRQHFNPHSAGIVFCVALVLGLGVQFVLAAFLHDDYALSLTYSIVAPLMYIATVFVLGRLLGVDVVCATGLKRAPGRVGLWALPLALSCVLAFLPIAIGVQALFALLGYHATPNYADYTSSWGKMLVGLVGLALMPALGEETLLRGCVYSGLRNKGTYFGIAVSALLFALMHANPVQFIHQFLIGLVMAYLVYMTGTVWTSVLFHFCNNATVILYEFVCVQVGADFTIPWWGYLILFVVFAPVVVLLLYLFTRRCVRAKEQSATVETVFRPEGEAPWRYKLRKALDYQGDYLPYNTQYPMGAMWAAFGMTAVLWLVNTVVGWVG